MIKDAPQSLGHVVDLGANIGISALYFLTRNNTSKCILYEPNPKNIQRLRQNLKGFENRYELIESAVSDQAGEFDFGIESTGRYGGIGLKREETIVVPCLHINDVLRNALNDILKIDILKIDTEGVEIQTVNAIEPELLSYISTIYLEACPDDDLLPRLYDNVQTGTVRHLIKKSVRSMVAGK